jgi:hypothetical protein
MSTALAEPRIYRGFLDYNTTHPFGRSPKEQLALDSQMYFNGSKPIHAIEEDQNVNVCKIDNTGLVCVDTDGKMEYEYIEGLLKKHNIDATKLRSPSASNFLDPEQYYFKNHYWFIRENVEKNIGVNKTKLDILTKEIVFEPVRQCDHPWLHAVPMSDELYADIYRIGGGNAVQTKLKFEKQDGEPAATHVNIVVVDSSIPLEEIKFIDENTNVKDAKDYSTWKKVIFKIANKYGKTPLGLKMARYFSGKCPENYVEADVDLFYNNIKLEKIQECIFGLSKIEMELKREEMKEKAREALRKTMEDDRKQKEEAKEKERLQKEQERIKKKEVKLTEEQQKEQERLKKKEVKLTEAQKKEQLKQQLAECKSRNQQQQEENYKKMKKEFEKVRSKIKSTGRYVEIFGNTDNVNMFSKQQMIDKWCHMSYGEDEKGMPISFIYRWINDPEILTYDDIDIFPKTSLCPPNVYNLWRPFAMEKVTEYTEDKEGLEVILNHIRILCNHDESAYNQFIIWMAHIIQHPEQRSICPTIISGEGTGKTTLYLWLEKILGADKCFITSQPMLHIFGNFNSAIQNKILILHDDPVIENLKAYQTAMLTHITSETIDIHVKGQSVFTTKAFHRDCIITNLPDGLLKEEKGGSRRNLTMTASDEKVGDHVYFTKLYALRDSVDAMKTFYEYLKKLPNVPLVLERPMKTDFQNEITAASKKPLQLWMQEFVGLEYSCLVQLQKRIENGSKETLPDGDYKVTLTIKEILDKYERFCIDNKFKFMNENAVKIGVSLFHLKRSMKIPEDCIVKKETKTCSKQVFNITKLVAALGIADLEDDDEEVVEETKQ